MREGDELRLMLLKLFRRVRDEVCARRATFSLAVGIVGENRRQWLKAVGSHPSKSTKGGAPVGYLVFSGGPAPSLRVHRARVIFAEEPARTLQPMVLAEEPAF